MAHTAGPRAWRQFSMDIGRLDPDAVEAILTRHGAQSITFTDAGDDPQLEPGPGATPLWQESRITGLFAADADLDALRADLAASLGLDVLPAHSIEALGDRDWEREWLRFFEPMRFGKRLWICPGHAAAPDPGAVVVRLDPGLAFGTGTHATTALCLEWLDGIDVAGRTLLDYGCGSGILAIAALKLGAAGATAVDIDPQAVVATRSNARANGVAERLAATTDAAGAGHDFDLVVANILAGPLIDLADHLLARTAPGCLLALSGILSGQVEDVRRAYSHRVEFEPPVTRDQDGQTWARLTGRRIEG
ncbi:MAG: 50S ribosomal protein L11 methyltransferase [Woeseiaceae bacterium]|nr:50S ribosomal protein L11 methyltransferase [Woeseiaceae bacterium]